MRDSGFDFDETAGADHDIMAGCHITLQLKDSNARDMEHYAFNL